MSKDSQTSGLTTWLRCVERMTWIEPPLSKSTRISAHGPSDERRSPLFCAQTAPTRFQETGISELQAGQFVSQAWRKGRTEENVAFSVTATTCTIASIGWPDR